MVGTATADEGDYILPTPFAGFHRIYASMIGFSSAAVDTLVESGRDYTINFRLQPDVLHLGGVLVVAERDAKWRSRLRKFEREFVGTSDAARETEILNPEVLDLDGGFGWIEARAGAPLRLINRALGYHVTYYLKDFRVSGGTLRYDGEPLFEALAPADEAEAERWGRNRRRAFYGSVRHYLLALLDGQTKESGFLTFRRFDLASTYGSNTRYPTDPAAYLSAGPTAETRTFVFDRFLEVVYTKEPEDGDFLRWIGSGRSATNQRSWLEMNEDVATVDLSGEIVEPYAITVYGYFAFERIGDLLPKEYRPN